MVFIDSLSTKVVYHQVVKIETGTEGWIMYVKDSKNISPEYSQYLFERLREMQRIVNDVIKPYKNKD